ATRVIVMPGGVLGGSWLVSLKRPSGPARVPSVLTVLPASLLSMMIGSLGSQPAPETVIWSPGERTGGVRLRGGGAGGGVRVGGGWGWAVGGFGGVPAWAGGVAGLGWGWPGGGGGGGAGDRGAGGGEGRGPRQAAPPKPAGWGGYPAESADGSPPRSSEA